MLVDNDTFLKQLTALFEKKNSEGSIWLTHKRLNPDGEDGANIDNGHDADIREYPCILRATDGKQTQFSTQVEPGDLIKFHVAYGALLKSSMTTLRKRDKKREKLRAEHVARRKKKIADPVVIDGPKRGNGRRKRQRQIKAAIKQEISVKKFKEREEARRKVEITI